MTLKPLTDQTSRAAVVKYENMISRRLSLLTEPSLRTSEEIFGIKPVYCWWIVPACGRIGSGFLNGKREMSKGGPLTRLAKLVNVVGPPLENRHCFLEMTLLSNAFRNSGLIVLQHSVRSRIKELNFWSESNPSASNEAGLHSAQQ
jgi:hypothetical protein